MPAKAPRITMTPTEQFGAWVKEQRTRLNMTESEFLAMLIAEKVAEMGFQGELINGWGSYERQAEREADESQRTWEAILKAFPIDEE